MTAPAELLYTRQKLRCGQGDRDDDNNAYARFLQHHPPPPLIRANIFYSL